MHTAFALVPLDSPTGEWAAVPEDFAPARIGGAGMVATQRTLSSLRPALSDGRQRSLAIASAEPDRLIPLGDGHRIADHLVLGRPWRTSAVVSPLTRLEPRRNG